MANEKMLNITHYQRNANQNYKEVSTHTIIKKSTNNKCWRGCGEKRTPLHCIVGRNAKKEMQKQVVRVLNVVVQSSYMIKVEAQRQRF